MNDNEESKPEFTDPIKCGHCGNFAPMRLGAVHSTVEEHFEAGVPVGSEGDVYQILECPSCGKIILTKTHDDSTLCEFEGPYETEILYPVDDKLPIGLPESIKKAYEAARKVRHIDANAYGVLIGRLLELVCVDRKAVGKDLHSKLADLAAKGEIPNNLLGVADGLRNLRNVGAHPGLGELTKEEAPIVASLARAILEYVYSASHLARLAQEKIEELKKKRKTSTGSQPS